MRGRAGRRGPQRTRRPRCLTAPRDSVCPLSRRFDASNGQPQVRPTHGVPRAVFIGLLRAAPGGRTFQALRLSGANASSTAMDPRWRMPRLTRFTSPPPAGSVVCGWQAGTARLGPPGGKVCAASPTPPSRPPLPAPRLETLIRHPSLSGRDQMNIVLSRNKVKRHARAVIPAECAAREPGSSTPCALDRLRRTGCPPARA